MATEGPAGRRLASRRSIRCVNPFAAGQLAKTIAATGWAHVERDGDQVWFPVSNDAAYDAVLTLAAQRGWVAPEREETPRAGQV